MWRGWPAGGGGRETEALWKSGIRARAAAAIFWGAELGSGMRGLGQIWNAGGKGQHRGSKHSTGGAGEQGTSKNGALGGVVEPRR